MADFAGMTVKVTLRRPTNNIVYGQVLEVLAGQTLTLQNLIFSESGERHNVYTVQNSWIADLEVVDANSVPIPLSTTQQPPTPQGPVLGSKQWSSMPTRMPTVQAQELPRQTANFIDPAILSYGKSPAPKPIEAPSTPIKSILAKAAENLPSNSSPFVAEAENGATRNLVQAKEPSHGTSDHVQSIGSQREVQVDTVPKKKVRRGQKKKQTPGAPQDPPPKIMNTDVSRNGNDMNTLGNNHGKGWRQTPLLQPLSQKLSPHDNNVAQKARRRREKAQETQQNGWATEDATDIQEKDDFDFEAANSLFDKQHVFEQLRQGDTTADEDRLVSHNKASRPGTYGGKNLHPTENVLSPKLSPQHNGNNLDSSSDADTELDFANARSSSKHSTTRNTQKMQPSRQNSIFVDTRPHPLTASMSSDRGLAPTHSTASLAGKSRKGTGTTATSRQDRGRSPQSAISMSRTQAVSSQSVQQDPHLAIHPTMTKCPVLLPQALEMLEHETISRYGLTPEGITESAGRCIAEIAMTMFDSTTSNSRRESRATIGASSIASSQTFDTNNNSSSVIVIIVSNHAAGARALCAARHLLHRCTQIILAEAFFESSETQDPQIRAQTAILKRLIKGGANIKRGSWQKTFTYIKNLSGPPAVIIDALLAGGAVSNSRDGSLLSHAEEAREIIEWANRSRAPVLSLACPSGVDGVSGRAPIVDGEPLGIRPEKVLSFGTPFQGILAALIAGERWDVSLADIGINIALRSEEAVRFGSEWLVDLRLIKDEDGTAVD